MTRKPPIHTPEGMKAFLDDKNWKDVDHPKDEKIKVSSLPKVGGARVKKRSRIEEIAHEILEGLSGKGKLPAILKHHENEAESNRQAVNKDEDDIDSEDRAHWHNEKAQKARGLMSRLKARRQQVKEDLVRVNESEDMVSKIGNMMKEAGHKYHDDHGTHSWSGANHKAVHKGLKKLGFEVQHSSKNGNQYYHEKHDMTVTHTPDGRPWYHTRIEK